MKTEIDRLLLQTAGRLVYLMDGQYIFGFLRYIWDVIGIWFFRNKVSKNRLYPRKRDPFEIVIARAFDLLSNVGLRDRSAPNNGDLRRQRSFIRGG